MEFAFKHPGLAIAALVLPMLLLVAHRLLARCRWLNAGQQAYEAIRDGAIANEDVEHLLGDGSRQG